jgi:endonuclease/exonuclease/phosphatase family metal-dependent hydrolase
MPSLRVATLNLWSVGGVWNGRREVLAAGFRELSPDLVAFQEAYKTGERDTVREILAAEFHVHHQTTGLIGDGNCAAVASRWPFATVHELDQQLGPRTADFPVTTLIAEVEAPEPVGPLLFVNHLPSWKPQLERERELQTVAAARAVEQLVAERPRHVVLAGDLDAEPDAASIRFLRGLQSLDATSVVYRDAWATAHPDETGETFTLRNPLVMEDSDVVQERSRRIDYVFVRADEHGPSLEITSCDLLFDAPVGGVWASDHFGLVAELEPRRDVRPA